MRHVHEQRDNRWPRDMRIATDFPNHLLTLLMVREGWGIASDVAIPALAPTPDLGRMALPATASKHSWTERWKSVWNSAWEWYGTRNEESWLPGTMPPMWEVAHGRAGLDSAALNHWIAELRDQDMSLAADPERSVLDALIPAWESGISSIIVLPYGQGFVRRITGQHLVVSKSTRDDSDAYRVALRRAAELQPRMLTADDAGPL